MALVTTNDLKQFLNAHKFDLAVGSGDVPEELLESSTDKVIAKLRSNDFPVAKWTTPENTPRLVRTAIAMLVAGYYYNTTFSEEDATEANYGARLIRRAFALVDAIASGEMLLEEDDVPLDFILLPVQEETDPAFSMGQVF